MDDDTERAETPAARSKFRLDSHVIDDDCEKTLREIFETGECSNGDQSRYAENYRFFREQWKKYAADNLSERWENWSALCKAFLKRCMILSVEAAGEDAAQRIFDTLNDRGMPLEDADIFKARIIKFKPEERDTIRKRWQTLESLCKAGKITSKAGGTVIEGVSVLFRYYMHVLRARANESNIEQKMRKFYAGADGKYERLQGKGLLNELTLLANFWRSVNLGTNGNETDYPQFSFSDEARKYVQVLSAGTKEDWRFPLSVFAVKNCGEKTFDEQFCALLKRLTAYLYASHCIQGFKYDRYEMYHAYCAIQKGEEWKPEKIKIGEVSSDKLLDPSKQLERGLLLLFAYLDPNQKGIIPDNTEIEHIYPKTPSLWQIGYMDWDEDAAETLTETLGNKMMLEKPINIKVSNNYFGIKKRGFKSGNNKEVQGYDKSKIASVKTLCTNHTSDDWTPTDVKNRDEEIKKALFAFFNAHLK